MTRQIVYLAFSTLLLSAVCLEVNAVPSLPCGPCSCGVRDRQRYILDNSCPSGYQLQMNSQRLVAVEPGAFKRSWDTKILDLGENWIYGLDPDVFHAAGDLNTLDLGHNELSTLPEGIFDHNKNLVQLDLADNQLVSLPDRAFDNCKWLRAVDLRNNRLTKFPDDIFKNQVHLYDLYLFGNQFTTFQPNLFKAAKQLKYLYMSNNNITSLPPKLFFGLTKLNSLDLSFNSLSKLHEQQFMTQKELAILGLANNNLTTLPDRMFLFNRNITRLWLHHNKIDNLKRDTFAGLYSPILRLYLHDNRISSLDEAVFPSTIQILQLQDNPIPTLPARAFNGLRGLKTLYLENLPLRTAPEANVFKTLVSLETLSLYNCSLKTLPMGIFDSLTGLRELNLARNMEMRGLSPKILANNNKLTYEGLLAYSWTFTLDSLWRQCGVIDTSDWRYKMVLNFKTKLRVAQFGDRVLSRCNGGSLVCLPGNTISLACSCAPGQVHDGNKCVLASTTQCSPTPFPDGGSCNMYPTCTANYSVGAYRRMSDHCSCPPNTLMVPNPCPPEGGKVCGDVTHDQCTEEAMSCNRRRTHVCVCAAQAKALSCIPRGSCNTGPLRARYPTAFGQKTYIRNGFTFLGPCDGAHGSVEFTCNNGQISVVEKCHCITRPLLATYPAALKGEVFIEHGKSLQRKCSNSASGYIRFTCSNRKVTVDSQCWCKTTSVAQRYPDTFHGITAIKFGHSITSTCQRVGNGTIRFTCTNGTVIVKEECGCVPGTLQRYFPNAFSSPSPVTGMGHNQVIENSCPHGGTIAFTCNNGNISIANKCRRIKCRQSNFVSITFANIPQADAIGACSSVGGTVPHFNWLHNECSAALASRGGTLVWLREAGKAKTLVDRTRNGVWGLELDRANSKLTVSENTDRVNYVCQLPLRSFLCGGKALYLVPTHSADGTFTTRNYHDAKQECSERKFRLPSYSDHDCTRMFLQKISGGHRWSAWLDKFAGHGSYYAVDTVGPFAFGAPSPLTTTICST